MDFESKIISREISQILWEIEKTVGTAESCTGGRIAEALISTLAPLSISKEVSSLMWMKSRKDCLPSTHS